MRPRVKYRQCIFTLFAILVSSCTFAIILAPCDKTRYVFTDTWGVITDGPSGSNYTENTHCEWLIQANSSQQKFITLNFLSMGTECSYDYVFVYDGDSFKSPLLGSFSGKTDPQQLTAVSGHMLILLYSDTNYALHGFRAEYSITECPNNCTKHGVCVDHTCYCFNDWTGADCSREICPSRCAGRGMSSNVAIAEPNGICTLTKGCECKKDYAGRDCSLHKTKPIGNEWHWLSKSNCGGIGVAGSGGGNRLPPRAAHTAVYIKETDSLYVFGGYDLNNILGDLQIYNFSTSRWHNEYLNYSLHHHHSSSINDNPWNYQYSPFEDSDSAESLSSLLEKFSSDEDEWAAGPSKSLFRNLLYSFNNSMILAKQRARNRRSSLIKKNSNEKLLNRAKRLINEEEEEESGRYGALVYDDDEHEKDISKRNVPNIPKDNSKDIPNKIDEQRPLPRYGHAAAAIPTVGFVIYGGKLNTAELSQDLWLYNTTTRKWIKCAQNSKIKPPALTRHTLTLAKDYLYLFGGSTKDGEFSSKLYKINATSLDEWHLVQPRGGKELDIRLVAHTTNYHTITNSLIVYSGVAAGVARFSKLSDRMYIFQLESRVWSEIHYPREHLRERYVPRERAFHTADIIGNYLVVFGGYSHRHNKEEICYDNQMYLYHLGCHAWINPDVLGSSSKSRYPKTQGMFAHASSVRNGNTLLLVGGYHGNVNGDLLAYVVPPSIGGNSDSSIDYEGQCSLHKNYAECSADPECGWCSADELCYGRTIGANCTTNLQSTRCPGICPALGDCHSCLIHGKEMDDYKEQTATSVANKLGLNQCTWCVQNAKCHHKNDNYGVCGVREDASPTQVPGWWGIKGTEVLDANQCRELDKRPGLTFLKYLYPANWSQPDLVTIINATTVDFNVATKSSTRTELALSGEMVARLRGFLRPPFAPWWQYDSEMLRVCVSYSGAILKIQNENSVGGGNEGNQNEFILNLSAEQNYCKNESWPDYLTPKGGDTNPRFIVDFESHKSGPYSTHQQSKMELLHFPQNDFNPKVFTFEYLEPYAGNGTCSQYTNCLHCLTDSMCGWCELNNKCLPRTINETISCTKENSEDDEWRYLTLQPSACTNCSNFISCERCVSSGMCEWWAEDAICARLGRAPRAVISVESCPAPCHKRPSCSACLEEKGRCVWCEATQQCFSFSVYTSEYQFGLCREWLDQALLLTTLPNQQLDSTQADLESVNTQGVVGGGQQMFTTSIVTTVRKSTEQCKSCSSNINCTQCLRTLSCGWCYSKANPINGFCVEGDFNRPHKPCELYFMNFTESNNIIEYTTLSSMNDSDSKQNDQVNEKDEPDEHLWSYAQCPDVDECRLGLHNCHPQAECNNTHGSFTCQCKRGYIGDGVTQCIRTCYNKCVHGRCLGAPDYQCECDLGWTGVDCSVNCGCNNHSTCQKYGVGVCDQCDNWTTGQFCQFCMPGSYGNATTEEGCTKCECNGHGVASKGYCDIKTGVCFCQDNTEGDHCEKCKRNYFGDPLNSGQCYFECQPRGMLTGLEGQGIGAKSYTNLVSPNNKSNDNSTTQLNNFEIMKECLWIISPDTDKPITIQLIINASALNVTCGKNSVYAYDGLPDLANIGGTTTANASPSATLQSSPSTQLIGVFCSDDYTPDSPLVVETKSKHLTVHYRQHVLEEGFNAIYKIYECSEQCNAARRYCNVNNECVCENGFKGFQCEIEVCPKNCSFEEKRGHCDIEYGRCLCSIGWGGNDCSKRLNLNDEDKPPVGVQELDELKSASDLPDYGSNIVFTELFNTEKISESLDHLKKTLPRFGHTLVADNRRNSLWMFGGLSLSNGVLNDLRLFDTRNKTWMPVVIESIGQNEATMPQGRYFHAAEICPSLSTIYVYGGLTNKGNQKLSNHPGEDSNVLNDFWQFNIHNRQWSQLKWSQENVNGESTTNATFENSTSYHDWPPSLAGHTLTLIYSFNQPSEETLLLLGGFSTKLGFMSKIYEWKLIGADANLNKWLVLNTTGPYPRGIAGHTAVYYVHTQCLYVFGGFMFETFQDGQNMHHGRVQLSNKLYVLHYPTRKWSLLPPMPSEDFNHFLSPRSRFLHSAVATDDYMIVFGGRMKSTHAKKQSILSRLNRITSKTNNDILLAYKFSCNQWVQLLHNDVPIVGQVPATTYAHSMTLDLEQMAAYVVGGLGTGTNLQVGQIKLPRDLCHLWSYSKFKCLRHAGCGFCGSYWPAVPESSFIDNEAAKHLTGNITNCYSITPLIGYSLSGSVSNSPMNIDTSNNYIEHCQDYANATKITQNGLKCDDNWLAQRNCSYYTTCTSCLSTFPIYNTINSNTAPPSGLFSSAPVGTTTVPPPSAIFTPNSTPILSENVCKWCGDKCVSATLKDECVTSEEVEPDDETHTSAKLSKIENVDQCPEQLCVATDCQHCLELPGCAWIEKTREQWQCLPIESSVLVPPRSDNGGGVGLESHLPKISDQNECPKRCGEYKTCSDCLNASSGEGGIIDCHWSINFMECISPSYQFLYCVGGGCGLVLEPDNIDQCPEPCSSFTQCSTCLKNSRCGWCARTGEHGDGICAEGSLKSPSENPAQSSCDILYYEYMSNKSKNVSTIDVTSLDSSTEKYKNEVFTWNYVKCPAENECLNGHHTCDKVSEVCVDMEHGFKCVCAKGYKLNGTASHSGSLASSTTIISGTSISTTSSSGQKCIPVCSQGCVRGVCIEPDVCVCDFGYVGANCSIQCQCNGHSNCAGPDKLDVCLECHNNTMGSQCEKCKPLFVGDPTQNRACIPCHDYCNGHSSICMDETSQLAEPTENMTIADIEGYLIEGTKGTAKCIRCANQTSGLRCEDCVLGTFRGSENHRDPCRPCECHGHGDFCDPVTGENCNCQNNTESDTGCRSLLSQSNKNSPQQCWMVQCAKCKDTFVGTPTAGHQCYKTMTADNKMCFDAKPIDECKLKPKPLHTGNTVFFAVQPHFMNVDIRIIIDVTVGNLDLYLSPQSDTFVVNYNHSTASHQVELDPRYRWKGDDQFVEVHAMISKEMKNNNNLTYSYFEDVWRHKRDKSPWVEKEVRGLSTYITVIHRNIMLVVRGLSNRLVLTLPQHKHELSTTKFYLVLQAVPGSGPNGETPSIENSFTMQHTSLSGSITNLAPSASYGMIFFRQDQLHIDLFVFFSVFFSCFFLFLAACVVAWKAKQAADIRRARRRHVVEMLHMAKRPFATCSLLLNGSVNSISNQYDESSINLQSINQNNNTRNRRQRSSSLPTSTLNGEYHQRGARFRGNSCTTSQEVIRPVAVEPTNDNVAAVATVFIKLPGGKHAPVKLALASTLIQMSKQQCQQSNPNNSQHGGHSRRSSAIMFFGRSRNREQQNRRAN